MTTVLVPRERRPGETRVAATPETVKRMVKEKLEVVVERGAGAHAHLADEAYAAAGARLADEAPWGDADVVLKVAPPLAEEAARVKRGALVIGLLAPHRFPELATALNERGASALALELLPRITRAQGMDALSSQASIAGYKAVLLAANRLGRYFPLLMTAAGTIPPARVVIMGAGVAGLQAVATAKRLGAVVEVSDIRAAVKEQVESLGGRFIELPASESGEGAGGYAREMSAEFLNRQREIVARHVAAADAVITTALVPGKRAPVLVSRAMVESMHPGTVIVDLAAAEGGNCELSRPDEEVLHGEVTILAPTNLAAMMAADASTIYSRNVLALLLHVLRDGQVALDPADEIVGAALVTSSPVAPTASATGSSSPGP
ncbi:MAG TPA: Re/Si-specific NAD(P)(+) transhydrogenase subunit alpha [Thermoanaerobaculia bacterium]|nr:Re/Si-specific NAD(P)(+) transhydrogenase subunit alpha [Thermoanaerobaculia bacterium]